jgi:hypothetical protein
MRGNTTATPRTLGEVRPEEGEVPMRMRATGLLSFSVAMFLAAGAHAVVVRPAVGDIPEQGPNCGGNPALNCLEYKYGLTHPDDFKNRLTPLNPIQLNHANFKGSYAYTRGSRATGACDLGEIIFGGVYGQIVIREHPVCESGTPGFGTNPDGATCCSPGATLAQACPFEIARDLTPDAPNPPSPWQSGFENPREFFGVPVLGDAVNFTLSTNGVFAGHGTPPTGGRVLEGGGPGTRLVFSQYQNSQGGQQSQACCVSATGNTCQLLSDFDTTPPTIWVEYPLIINLVGNNFFQNGSQARGVSDLIFAGGAGTDFRVDEVLAFADQWWGVCSGNRFVGCQVRDANGPIADPCPGMGLGTCDLRELGWRFDPRDVIRDGGPLNGQANNARCNTAPYVIRGFAGTGCSLFDVYETNGDPGPFCMTRNFGPYAVADLDCNGVADRGDLCPHYNEVDKIGDANGDGRGDECSCGNTNPPAAPSLGGGPSDNAVNVSDIVTTNLFIFNPHPPGIPWEVFSPLAEANGSPRNPASHPTDPFDVPVDVQDLVSVNTEIFNFKTSTCLRSPVAGE